MSFPNILNLPTRKHKTHTQGYKNPRAAPNIFLVLNVDRALYQPSEPENFEVVPMSSTDLCAPVRTEYARSTPQMT